LIDNDNVLQLIRLYRVCVSSKNNTTSLIRGTLCPFDEQPKPKVQHVAKHTPCTYGGIVDPSSHDPNFAPILVGKLPVF
jgi:hypothetical protein